MDHMNDLRLNRYFPQDIYTLKLEQTKDGKLTKITNDTPHTVYLGVVPKPPSRKMKDVILVPAETYHIKDNEFPLEGIYLRFE